MSFNNDSNRNFQANYGSAGTNELRSGFGRVKDNSTGSGFNNNIDNFSSDRAGDSYGSGFDNNNKVDNLNNDRTQGSYDRDTTGNFARDSNTTNTNFNSGDNTRHNNADFTSTSSGNDGPSGSPRDASGGRTGVMASTFGAENTTTSTFEQSQGKSYGDGFDESGERLKKDFGIEGQDGDRRRQTKTETGDAAGGGDYSMGGKQADRAVEAGNATNTPGWSGEAASSSSGRSSGHSSSPSSGQKQGLGQKVK